MCLLFSGDYYEYTPWLHLCGLRSICGVHEKHAFIAASLIPCLFSLQVSNTELVKVFLFQLKVESVSTSVVSTSVLGLL